MKTELVVILALAAALSFHRDSGGSGGSACGSSGCLILPLELQPSSKILQTNAAPPAGEIAAANPDALH